jgi:hypothetical protein
MHPQQSQAIKHFLKVIAPAGGESTLGATKTNVLSKLAAMREPLAATMSDIACRIAPSCSSAARSNDVLMKEQHFDDVNSTVNASTCSI